MKYYFGVEGGATGSVAVLLDESGKELAQTRGSSTNHWMVGLEEVCITVSAMLEKTLNLANLPEDTTIQAMGLMLSGIDTEEDIRSLKESIFENCRFKLNQVFVGNDTLGTKCTAFTGTSIVLISGTGSNCRLFDVNGESTGTGGYGYKLGDEGSAYSIAAAAIKLYVDLEDGIYMPQFDFTKLKKVVKGYFNLDTHYDIIKYMYAPVFEKGFVARLCSVLAKEANAGDISCSRLFFNAGHDLGRLVATLIRKHYNTNQCPRSLDVVCCGSVFKSWNLLREGFIVGLSPHYSIDKRNYRLCLHQLLITAAFGAAFHAMQEDGSTILHRSKDSVKVIDIVECSNIPLAHDICSLACRL